MNHCLRHKTYPLLKKGKTINEIAKLTNVGATAIRRHRYELFGPNNNPPPRYEWSKIQQYYDEGHSRIGCLKHFGFETSAWSKAVASGRLRLDPKRCNRYYDNTNMIGKRFHSLVVIAQDEKNSDRLAKRWTCQCDCGNIVIASTSNLNQGGKKSCGCRKRRIGNKNPKWTGHGEIDGSHWTHIQSQAKNRHGRSVLFGITIQETWQLFLKQNRMCAISGVDISTSGGRGQRTASLDRIDSEKGYTLDNVQWVHKDVNYLKMDFTMEQLLTWVNTIYHYQHGLRSR